MSIKFGTYKKHTSKKKKETNKYDKIPEMTREDSRWDRLLSLMSYFNGQSNNTPSENPIINVTIEHQAPFNQSESQNNSGNQFQGFQDVRDYHRNAQADANALKAYQYLTNDMWGFSPAMASGIIGNLYHENLANPAQTVNDSKGTTAFGIAGFNSNGLLRALQGYAAERNLDINDLYTQLDFIADYIVNGVDPNLTREMYRPDLTPEHSAFSFGRYFERFRGRDGSGKGYLNYDDDEHARRRDSAVSFYNKYNK